MNQHRRFFGFALLLSVCATLVCPAGRLEARQSTEKNEGSAGAGAMPTTPVEFEVKISKGDFLVRRKGTTEWKQSLNLSEPVVIGIMDGDQKIYAPSKAVKAPIAIHQEDPIYPSSEKKSGKRGQALLHIVVDAHGEVRNPEVYSSTGPEFAAASIDAVRKWKFHPAQLNDHAVAALTNVEMDFMLY